MEFYTNNLKKGLMLAQFVHLYYNYSDIEANFINFI